MKTTYNTKIYQALKSMAAGMIIVLSSLAITIYFCVILKIPPSFSAVIIISVFCSPLIYAKRLKAHFTYFVDLTFDDLSFSCNLSKDGTSYINTFYYEWSDLKSYSFYFSTGKYTSLIIYPKRGRNKTFTFMDNKNENNSIGENIIFNIFRKQINRYNELNKPEKINMIPSLFATRLGLIILWIITLIVIFAIIVHIVKPIKPNVGFLIMGICVLIPLWIQRSKSKRLYKRMKELDSDN